MAWVDNSSVQSRGDYEEWKNAPRAQPVDRNRIWQFFIKLPGFKILFQYFQSFFVLKKIEHLQQKIQSDNFDSLKTTLPILKELFRLKKISSASQKEIIAQLKKALITKSHLSLFSSQEIAVNPKRSASSHKSILDSLQVEKENTHIVQPMPTTLYWCSAGHDYQSIAVAAPQSNAVRLHTSVDNLIDLLKAPHLHFADNQDFHPEWDDQNPSLVCGISFMPACAEKLPKQIGFWQNECGKLLPSMKLAAEHVEEIVFKTDDHFRQFKETLTQNKEASLLELIFDLESRAQIRIDQPVSLIPV